MTQTTTATFLKAIRQYFWSKDFTEVEIPYLNESLPLEPNLYSFKINSWYLPTSPEFALKQYLAQHQSNCFALAHCFRNLESTSPWHTPEFLMLEWYEINKNVNDLKISTQNFIKLFLPNLKFVEYKIKNINFDNEPDFNQYFLNEVQPCLPRDCGVFVTGYPAFLSPLAKPVGTDPCVCSSNRFELYINGIEIANGCEENRDSKSIEKAFILEQEHRQKNNLPTHPISKDFIKDCSKIPPCSGIGLGLDRLLKIINTKI
ncbi:MAG: amino acid--tRNA ligase-related protein [bacterium]|nr:amino acid--tRNA ligase-related protein [bacterium]